MNSLGDYFPQKEKDKYSERILTVGCVLKFFVSDTIPPKEKRFIVVGISEDRVSLATVYINSMLNTNVNFSTDLQSLHLSFSCDTRDYLDHDSFVDCSRLIERDGHDVQNIIKSRPDVVIGEIASEDYQLIKKAIISAGTIKGKKKKKYGFYDN